MDQRTENKELLYTLINNNSIVYLNKDISESMSQFIKRNEFYIKAKNNNIDDDKAITLSVLYTNKLKYNVIYNDNIELIVNNVIVS